MDGIYVITDGAMTPGRSHTDIAKAAAEGGAGCVQLRDKNLPGRQLFEVARALRRIASRRGMLFIVNDRIDVALASEADGAHVGQDDMPMRAARRLMGRDAVIGVSAASVEEAVKAQADGADYVGLGPIFSTATKADAGEAVGLEMITKVKRAVRIPVVAIGGIAIANAADVAAAGADSAAVISAVVCAPDMAEAVRALRQEWEKGKARK